MEMLKDEMAGVDSDGLYVAVATNAPSVETTTFRVAVHTLNAEAGIRKLIEKKTSKAKATVEVDF
jgi:hypothetical protein